MFSSLHAFAAPRRSALGKWSSLFFRRRNAAAARSRFTGRHPPSMSDSDLRWVFDIRDCTYQGIHLSANRTARQIYACS
jgi:hypothetical protein